MDEEDFLVPTEYVLEEYKISRRTLHRWCSYSGVRCFKTRRCFLNSEVKQINDFWTITKKRKLLTGKQYQKQIAEEGITANDYLALLKTQETL